MTPIEEILKISQNLEQILQNQYGAVGRGLREKVDSVADQIPEGTVRKISKLATMRNRAAHENVMLANEKIAVFRRITGEVLVSLMLYQPFEGFQSFTRSEDRNLCPDDSVFQYSTLPQESAPIWKENDKFSWHDLQIKLRPVGEYYQRQRRLYYELLNDYSPTSRKVQDTVSQMFSAIKRLYDFYDEALQLRQEDLQALIDDECRPDSPIMISTQKDIDKLKQAMSQLQPENTAESVLKCIEGLKWLYGGIRKILTSDWIDYAFRWCPPGDFIMGSTNGQDWEKPIHKVKLSKGFWMLETEVTQAMWQSVTGKNPSKFKGALNPVEQVSWNACQEFCWELSEKLGLEVQLPTEAQWEYACRADTMGNYAGDLVSMAWFDKNGHGSTHPVAQKQRNFWGLYDMHGNVWEWCSDSYNENYYDRSPLCDPENTEPSSNRVIRGGSWLNGATYCRSASRAWCGLDGRSDHLGLRVILVPSSEE